MQTHILTQNQPVAAALNPETGLARDHLWRYTYRWRRKSESTGKLLVENRQPVASPVPSNDSEKLMQQPVAVDAPLQKAVEIGGPKGPEPTRYGDWEKAGRCTDF